MAYPATPSAEPTDDAPPLATEWEDRLVVEPNYAGWRLDRFLAEKLRRATRSQAARIVREGARLADGRTTRPSTRVRPGDTVILPRIETADPGAPELDAVRVLAAGAGWVALDKPAGMLVHRTAAEATRTVEVFLAGAFPGRRVEPVHRLDRDTSGVLLAGDGLDAIRGLKALLAGRAATKRYLAVARDPQVRWPVGVASTLDTALGFAGGEVRLRVGRGDWECATHVRSLARVGELCLLDVSIEGGRQHQIRAHLALEGTPLLGDKLYEAGNAFFLAWIDRPGAPELVERLPTRWHCLHAWRLHVPFGDASIELEARPHFLPSLGFDPGVLPGASHAPLPLAPVPGPALPGADGVRPGHRV